jgi:hypothetical protein
MCTADAGRLGRHRERRGLRSFDVLLDCLHRDAEVCQLLGTWRVVEIRGVFCIVGFRCDVWARRSPGVR